MHRATEELRQSGITRPGARSPATSRRSSSSPMSDGESDVRRATLLARGTAGDHLLPRRVVTVLQPGAGGSGSGSRATSPTAGATLVAISPQLPKHNRRIVAASQAIVSTCSLIRAIEVAERLRTGSGGCRRILKQVYLRISHRSGRSTTATTPGLCRYQRASSSASRRSDRRRRRRSRLHGAAGAERHRRSVARPRVLKEITPHRKGARVGVRKSRQKRPQGLTHLLWVA